MDVTVKCGSCVIPIIVECIGYGCLGYITSECFGSITVGHGLAKNVKLNQHTRFVNPDFISYCPGRDLCSQLIAIAFGINTESRFFCGSDHGWNFTVSVAIFAKIRLSLYGSLCSQLVSVVTECLLPKLTSARDGLLHFRPKEPAQR
ncbi:hypothetical protein Bca52824_051592 [Brassica carinata]|uniref:Uncharacterized protein n=1 Tax=Brassica carinata TaxID=52824 RepID=A0A8X7R2C8_BRACI|nr:hypothetical protein Bca52824_051592 [Brassica carinata]